VILRVSHASIVPAEAVSLNPRRAVRQKTLIHPPGTFEITGKS